MLNVIRNGFLAGVCYTYLIDFGHGLQKLFDMWPQNHIHLLNQERMKEIIKRGKIFYSWCYSYQHLVYFLQYLFGNDEFILFLFLVIETFIDTLLTDSCNIPPLSFPFVTVFSAENRNNHTQKMIPCTGGPGSRYRKCTLPPRSHSESWTSGSPPAETHTHECDSTQNDLGDSSIITSTKN